MNRRNFIKVGIGAALYIPASRLEFGVPHILLPEPRKLVTRDIVIKYDDNPNFAWGVKRKWLEPLGEYADHSFVIDRIDYCSKDTYILRKIQELSEQGQVEFLRRADGILLPLDS